MTRTHSNHAIRLTLLAGLFAWSPIIFTTPAGAADKPLVFDKSIGHFKDLSYEALTDSGLTTDQQQQLFGGETAHYGPLTDKQRATKRQELEALLSRIDTKLVSRCEADIRKWLDRHAGTVPAAYKGRDIHLLRQGAVTYFRAYEILGDRKYLEAGLARADVIKKNQWPKGHWQWGDFGEDFVRIQDGYNDWPFWIMLYAHKVSGEKTYLESARRCCDILLTIQRPTGGWPDQWTFSGRGTPHTGVRHGTSFNDGGTNAPLKMMVMMYHITGDTRYVAKLDKLGPFIAKSNLGKGRVVGWSEQYLDDGRPTRARRYEIELPYPRALTRAVGPMLIWLYLMTGDEAHIGLLKKAYAWQEQIRRKELEPKQIAAWKLMADSWARAGRPMHYRPGWPDAFLPDGTNWGRVTAFKLIPWYPVSDAMKKKYGGFIHSSTADAGAWPHKLGYLDDWAKTIRDGGQHPEASGGFSHAARNDAMCQVRRALLEHRRGGRAALRSYYSHPTRYTADQYLQARIGAARRCLDPRTVKLVSAADKQGVLTLKDPGGLVPAKTRWYGPVLSKWGTSASTSGRYGNVAWYEWQLVYDSLLARGRISADAAARGGRGLESVAMQTHLDSWDVLGEWGMAAHEVEDHFDVPLGKPVTGP